MFRPDCLEVAHVPAQRLRVARLPTPVSATESILFPADARPGRSSRAFTLTELLVTAAVLALAAFTLAPALSKTKSNSQAIRCQNNLRQFTAAWTMYCADYGDRVANNFGIEQTFSTITAARFENWANNVMTWGAGSSIDDRGNTNVAWVAQGVLSMYLGGDLGVYHCPADKYLSALQRGAGWKGRTRSISMNSVFGRFSNSSDPTANGLNWGLSSYVQFLKRARVPKPSRTWLVIDEHPDSINDGYFINNPTVSNWQDIPASYHDGGCGISFVDGHAELKRWQSSTGWYRVQFVYPPTRVFDALGRTDYSWYQSRTGWVLASTGQGQFGY